MDRDMGRRRQRLLDVSQDVVHLVQALQHAASGLDSQHAALRPALALFRGSVVSLVSRSLALLKAQTEHSLALRTQLDAAAKREAEERAAREAALARVREAEAHATKVEEELWVRLQRARAEAHEAKRASIRGHSVSVLEQHSIPPSARGRREHMQERIKHDILSAQKRSLTLHFGRAAKDFISRLDAADERESDTEWIPTPDPSPRNQPQPQPQRVWARLPSRAEQARPVATANADTQTVADLYGNWEMAGRQLAPSRHRSDGVILPAIATAAPGDGASHETSCGPAVRRAEGCSQCGSGGARRHGSGDGAAVAFLADGPEGWLVPETLRRFLAGLPETVVNYVPPGRAWLLPQLDALLDAKAADDSRARVSGARIEPFDAFLVRFFVVEFLTRSVAELRLFELLLSLRRTISHPFAAVVAELIGVWRPSGRRATDSGLASTFLRLRAYVNGPGPAPAGGPFSVRGALWVSWPHVVVAVLQNPALRFLSGHQREAISAALTPRARAYSARAGAVRRCKPGEAEALIAGAVAAWRVRAAGEDVVPVVRARDVMVSLMGLLGTRQWVMEEKVKELFVAMDVNGDGVLDVAEFVAVARLVAPSLGQRVIEQMYVECLSMDGSNSEVITPEVFVRVCKLYGVLDATRSLASLNPPTLKSKRGK